MSGLRAIPFTPEPMPPSFLQVKTLIWMQAAAMAALILGVGWSLLAGQLVVMVGVIACGGLWGLGLRQIAARASRLGPKRDYAPRGLSSWLLVLLSVGEISTLVWDFSGRGDLSFIVNLGANFLLATTVLFWGWMSVAMKLPLHRPTWYTILAAAGAGFLVRGGFLLLMLSRWGGC